jgi:hypothetical protein
MDNKPTLLQLRELYGLRTYDLAQAANVELDVVYLMLRGLPVSPEDAQRVLTGLSRLTGQHYTLDDLDMTVLEEEDVI